MAKSDAARAVLSIPVEGARVREICEAKVFETLLLESLAAATHREAITDPPRSEIEYDEWVNPKRRIEQYGDTEYGLKLTADPIASGIGVHGECGSWTFYGLPEDVTLEAESRLDMRGGHANFVSVTVEGPKELVAVVTTMVCERLGPYRCEE